MKIKSVIKGRTKTLNFMLILVLSLILLTSLIGLATSYTYPDQVTEEVVRAVVTQKIDLDYLVLVKEALIYDNRTVLRPGEVIYTKFLEGFNITYKLRLSSSKELRDVKGSYEVLVNISSPIWFKEVVVDSGDVGELLDVSKNLYVNFTYLRDYISRIEKEIGSSRAYTISIVFQAHTNVNVIDTDKSYDLTSTSRLELYYESGKPVIDVRTSTPEYRYVDSVKQAKIIKITLLWVSMDIVTYRILTMSTSITSAAGLALILAMTVNRSKLSKRIPTLFSESKYRDLVITGELEQIKQVVAVVRIRSFVDLVKVATMRRKPIVRLGSKSKFAVIEGDVIYLYEETNEKQK